MKDLKSYPPYLERVKSQLKYTIRFGVNQLAFGGAQAFKKQLSRRLILRNTWTLKGIRYRKAKNISMPTAVVFSRDEYLTKQQTGGRKKPKGNRYFSIPQAIRTNERKRITRAKQPARILQKKNTWISKGKILQRKKKKISVLYLFRKTAEFEPRINIGQAVMGYVKGNQKRIMRQAVRKAVKRAR